MLTNLSFLTSSQWASYTIMLSILAVLEQMPVIQKLVHRVIIKK